MASGTGVKLGDQDRGHRPHGLAVAHHLQPYSLPLCGSIGYFSPPSIPMRHFRAVDQVSSKVIPGLSRAFPRFGSPSLGALFEATVLLALMSGGTGSLAGQEQPSPFSIDDAIELASVGSPRISPDGSKVLFTLSKLDWEENERDSRIWIANADGSDARPFTADVGDANPLWSPDGRWVAFLRNAGEGDRRARQVFLLRTDGGEARQLTRHPTSVSNVTWAEDASRLFFTASDSLPSKVRKGRKDGADAVFVDEGPNGQTRSEWNGVWSTALDFEDGASRRHTPEGIRVGDYAVSPDGSRIAYTYRSENQRNAGHLGEIALVGTREGAMPVDLTDNDAPESRLAWSPAGDLLTFVAPSLQEWELDQGNLYAMDPETGETRELLPDWSADLRGYRWHPDGRHIELAALERTDSHLFRLDLASGRVERVSANTGIIGSPDYSRDHSAVAFTLADPLSPADVWVSSTDSFEPVRITRANPWVADRALVSPEVVRWVSADGLEIEGILYRPSGGGSAPGALVLEIHGGPAGVFTRSFDADAQLLAGMGYAVLQPNVRGSTGYGDALLRGNMEDIGQGDFQDVMTGVDAMIDRGIADPDSLAVRGWSYGGILGGWTITQTDRFRAASLGAMVADWRSEFGAGFNYDVTRWYIGGDPWSNRDGWLQASSYTHLDQVTTPTILFHGDNDTTDTMEQSMNFFQGLRFHGVESRFVRFPREGHGIREPRHRRTLLVEEVRWFETHVRGNVDWEAPERPEAEDTDEAAKVTS